MECKGGKKTKPHGSQRTCGDGLIALLEELESLLDVCTNKTGEVGRKENKKQPRGRLARVGRGVPLSQKWKFPSEPAVANVP